MSTRRAQKILWNCRRCSERSRLVELQRENLSEESKAIYDDIIRSRGGSIDGPFRAWLHSSELCDRMQKVGEFCRYKTGLSYNHTELAIMTVARFENCIGEWNIHEKFARESGLSEKLLETLNEKREIPVDSNAEEFAVFNFVSEMLSKKSVSDETFRMFIKIFGHQIAVELTVLVGYYRSIAMTFNTFKLDSKIEGCKIELKTTEEGDKIVKFRRKFDEKKILQAEGEKIARFKRKMEAQERNFNTFFKY